MATVSAFDIIPSAFGGAAGPKGATKEEDDITFDIRNLVAFNPHAISLEGGGGEALEARLKERATAGVQLLIEQLFALPRESTTAGPVATLPGVETTIIPREKPLPTPRAETKWEKFAKEKGITKKSTSRKVWDDDQKEWKPNWGYKRANNGVLDLPIVEVRGATDPMADPWTVARAAKKARVQKNLTQQVKNDMRAKGMNPMAGIPVDMLPAKATAAGKRKRGAESTSRALAVVQGSTASMGKFDSKRAGEPERKKGAVATIRQKFAPLVPKDGIASEGKGALHILNGVLINKDKKKGKGKAAAEANVKSSFTAYDAIEGNDSTSNRKKKGRGGVGKMKKITKKRAK